MSDSKLERLKKLPGSKTSQQSQSTKLEGLQDLIAQLKVISEGQARSHQEVKKSIDQLSLAVLNIADNKVDVTPIVDAIQKLSDKIDAKEQAKNLLDYRIDFERDKFNLMKSGIMLTAVPKRLN